VEEISFCNNKTPRETRRQIAATTTKKRTRYYFRYRYTYRYLPVALATAGVLVPGTVLPVHHHTRENSNHTAVGSSAAYRYQPATWNLCAVIIPLVPGSISSSGAPEFSSDTWLSTHLVPGTRCPIYPPQIASKKIPPSCRNFVPRTTSFRQY